MKKKPDQSALNVTGRITFRFVYFETTLYKLVLWAFSQMDAWNESSGSGNIPFSVERRHAAFSGCPLHVSALLFTCFSTFFLSSTPSIALTWTEEGEIICDKCNSVTM